MSDKLYTLSIEQLLKWALSEIEEGKIFGVYRELFFEPKKEHPYRLRRYGHLLENPLGVAAGPQTQMAQNIVISWLMGARYIELKTVQTLDEIEVTKPCIDMYDEGYNCEWSQELKIDNSYEEYLNAWIVIRVLKEILGFDEEEDGFIFNISIGYDLKGILGEKVQRFLDLVADGSERIAEKVQKLKSIYPRIGEIEIPSKLTDSVTLSTMHGCPPDEIESIASYLLEERKLNTTVKLNPTLLGPEKLREILNVKLGYETEIPDEAFEHDLKFDEAKGIIERLTKKAEENGVSFGLKLTNTLESLNATKSLPEKEQTVYMSGRALHPISINLAYELQKEFNGNLDISFSAGVDAFNIAEVLKCNLKPVTVCSDLLKPGGYTRLAQYFEELSAAFQNAGAHSIEELVLDGRNVSVEEAALENLEKYAAKVVNDSRYAKRSFKYDGIKTKRELTAFDCIYAPCMETCAISQDVPEYMYYVARGEFDKAFNVIETANPLPNVTGMVCDHLCQTKCTRLNYDDPLLIREIKRFVAERESENFEPMPKPSLGIKVAIIGAGPAGLSASYFLALEGADVEVFEESPKAGGMPANAIPVFRLQDEKLERDVENIKKLGVRFHFNRKIDSEKFEELRQEFDYVIVAVGAPQGKKLGIPGENSPGVLDQLNFLKKTRNGGKKDWNSVAVVGGGLSAVDAARTAKRLVGKEGNVTVLYRRTKREMPCGFEEIEAMEEEGINILELVNPTKIEKKDKLIVTCVRMELGEKDSSGRRKPLPIPNSDFKLEFDALITAIGQDFDLSFLGAEKLRVDSVTMETQFENVFAAGDVLRGADSLINAVEDGKKVAKAILDRHGKTFTTEVREVSPKLSPKEFQMKLSKRVHGIQLPVLEPEARFSFELVHPLLTEEEARKEAERCLFCNDVCNICVTVCPNLANLPVDVEPIEIKYPVVFAFDEKMQKVDYKTFKIEQRHQIINIGDFCNECGNCATFCPTSGAPYKTKPKFFLTRKSFDAETTGYFLSEDKLIFKDNGKKFILRVEGNGVFFESDVATAEFDSEAFRLQNVRYKDEQPSGVYDFRKAAEMFFLWKSLRNNPIFG